MSRKTSLRLRFVTLLSAAANLISLVMGAPGVLVYAFAISTLGLCVALAIQAQKQR
jgi:hypothetical protein